MKKEDIWVIIPIYNESERIVKVVDEVLDQLPNIIVVDDGSTDDSKDKLSDKKIIYIKYSPNKGKANALLVGCEEAFNLGAKAVIMLDGDGQHSPSEIPRFVELITSGEYDIIFGSRGLDKNMPMIRRIGNLIISKLLKVLYSFYITDTLSGYKSFTKDCFEKIRWNKSSRYNVESDIFINISKKRLRYKEITVQTIYNNKWSGITKTQGILIAWNILKRRFCG